MTSKRTPLARKHGKKYEAASKKVEARRYTPSEAVALLTEISTCSFDASAEAHIRINADPEQADQIVRALVELPHGTGKKMRIAAFVPDDLRKEAKEAGAEIVGNEDLMKDVQAGKIAFDAVVAHPSLMRELGKVAKVLGPKGLMPSPKAGTVTENIGKAVQALTKGRIECRMDKLGIIHVAFGKLSFGKEKLLQNFQALLQGIEEARPSGIKGLYMLSVTIAPTMGPGIRVDI